MKAFELLYPQGRFHADETGARALVKYMAERQESLEYTSTPIGEIFFDADGMILQNETEVWWSIDGLKFGAYLRGVSPLAELLQLPTPCIDGLEGFVLLGCRSAKILLAESTIAQLLPMIESTRVDRAIEISNHERDFCNAVEKEGAMYCGRCSCGSGLLFTKCCRVRGNN